MEVESVAAIVKSLNDHEVRYMIVGGLAVVAHGFVRLTVDVDLIFAMDEQNLQRAIAALQPLGYKPRAPVPFSEFADPAKRRQWQVEKQMLVFSLYSPQHAQTEIDLFLEPPAELGNALNRATLLELLPGVRASICALDDLMTLKQKAGRAKDLEDIARLRDIHSEDPS